MRFTLVMDRSPGFGSTATDSSPCSDSLSLRLRNPGSLTLPATVSRRIILQKARDQPGRAIGLSRFVSTRFQVLFHSPPGVLFTLSLTVLRTIGRKIIFSLGRWSSQIPTGFHVPRGTQVPIQESALFRLRDYHPLRSVFPDQFC